MNAATFLRSHESLLLSSAIIGETVLLVYVSVIPFFTPFSPAVAGSTMVRPGDIEHVVGYLVYGLLWARFLVRQGRPSWALYTLLAGTAVGLATEILQMAVPLRTFDGQDILLDVFGVTVGMVASRLPVRSPRGRKMAVFPSI